MLRRYFEHIYVEICLAVERRISRYDLWLAIWETGGDPDELTREQARRFVEAGLDPLLAEEGTRLRPRARRRLEGLILDFDARHPTPEEWLRPRTDEARDAA